MARKRALIADRYEVGEVIGHGGMAEVRLGRDVRLGRQVAIKLLRRDLARDPTFQARFRREAQSAASLNSPSIVAVYDTGEGVVDGNTTPYIVMEYVEGRTLRDILAAEGRLLPRRALEITAAICEALEQAHAAGIVHRDIKPGNVMVTATGEVKVMDFGIARALTSSTSTMTQTAAVVGTAHYLSPEQARGEHVDARSDIYSTGCVLYELLTGAPPFTGESAVAVAYQHVREDPAPPSTVEPDVPPDVDAIVLVAMAKNAVNRYANATEMRADIERALAGRPVHARPVLSGGEPLGVTMSTTSVLLREPPARRRGAAYAVLAAATLAVFVIALLIAQNVLTGNAGDLNTPNVVGQTYADAQSTLTGQGLRVGLVTDTYTQTNDKGAVVSQNPPAGILLRKGQSVDLVISNGIQYVTVPAGLVGLTQQQAKEALEQSKLKLGNVVVKNSPVTQGQVLDSDPAAGSTIAAGSKVTLTVSNSHVKVPDVKGDDEATATALLQQDGFEVTSKPTALYTKKHDGEVISQTPAGGAYADSGSTVIIYIDEQALPTTSPSPTITPTATDSTPPDGELPPP
ncbi:MAG TPA: Stk1 family PASTA domain-containing Ser/Thr kinase [Mycobacteriales bacterium]|jgi:serine/threonine-protein kinase|nr:Stk1 family PASTA domain-containing Ser/Thr kinase [Mycobacteriales bacterium]